MNKLKKDEDENQSDQDQTNWDETSNRIDTELLFI